MINSHAQMGKAFWKLIPGSAHWQNNSSLSHTKRDLLNVTDFLLFIRRNLDAGRGRPQHAAHAWFNNFSCCFNWQLWLNDKKCECIFNGTRNWSRVSPEDKCSSRFTQISWSSSFSWTLLRSAFYSFPDSWTKWKWRKRYPRKRMTSSNLGHGMRYDPKFLIQGCQIIAFV